MKIPWTLSAGGAWDATVEPFILKVTPKGDGRWTWEVFRAGNLIASGIRPSLGHAKTKADQFVTRSGLF